MTRPSPHNGARWGAAVAVLALSTLALTGSAGAREATTTDRTGNADQARDGERGGTTPGKKTKAPRTAHPGDIVSAEPSSYRPLPDLPSDAKAWKIQYRSTDANGQPNVVSGTVIIPDDDRTGPRPLITHAVGTVGLGDQCAPSAGFHDGSTREGALIHGAVQRGWAVAITDYQGLGTPGDHAYTVGPAAGSAVLDAARAAQRLPDSAGLGVSTDSPVGLMGYSQGGQASAWAAEMHHSYAPELKVKGSASGGTPANLFKVAEANNGGDHAGFLLMAAVGFNASYPELDLDKYFNDRGKKLTDEARNQCGGDILAAAKGVRIEELTTTNPLEQPDWQQRLGESTLGTKSPGVPALLYHSDADEIIPFEVGRKLRADWCAAGNPTDWYTFPGLSHTTAAMNGYGWALEWMNDRFEGKPQDGCGTNKLRVGKASSAR